MIEPSLRWEFMDHYAVQRRQLVNDLKRIELIGHMFRSSEIRHQAVFAFMLRWDAVEIQVELPRLPSISMAAYWNPSQCQKFERT